MEEVIPHTEDVVSKYKRLLSMARASLETNQRNLAEKDHQISQYKQIIDKLERDKSLATMNNGAMKIQEDSSLIPRSLVRRVDVNGLIWVLVQYDHHLDSWMSFPSEQDLDEFIQRVPGLLLTKPHKCYTPSESSSLEAEAKIKIDRIVEEFRRFKIKSEIARKQSTEDSKLHYSSTSSSPPRNTEDVENKYRDENHRVQSQLVAVEAKWKLAYEKLVRENETLRVSGGEAMLAAQWRERYELTSKEKYDLLEKLKVYERTGTMGKSIEESYNELKDEHRDLQRRMNAIDKRRGDDIRLEERAHLSLSSRADHNKLEYLKQMFLQYLSCRDGEVKVHIETAIENMFHFNANERGSIEERRRESTQDTLSAISNYFATSSSTTHNTNIK